METTVEKSIKTNTKLKKNNSKWKRNENGKKQNGMKSFQRRFAARPEQCERAPSSRHASSTKL